MALAEIPRPEVVIDGELQPGQLGAGPDDAEQTLIVVEQGALMADESRLSRAQVLDIAFTPRLPRAKQAGRLVCEKLVRLGDQELATVRPSSSFIAPQIRQVYDKGHFDRLGRNIRDSKYGQIQRGFVGLHDEESAERYLADLNEHFGSEITLDDLRWHKKFGGFLITVAGHNRQLGIAMANLESHGYFDRGIGFQVRVVRNPLFWEALRVQAVENCGQSPHMWERSREIKTIIEQSARHGEALKTEEVAGFFGTDPDQIPRALRYESLPDEVKQLVVDGKLPYSGAFELDRLFRVYIEQDVIELAQRFAGQNMSAEQIRQGVKVREVVRNFSDSIRAKVEAGLINYSQALEIDRLEQAEVDMGIREETADWIAITQPPNREVHKAVNGLIEARVRGDRNLFTGEEGMAAEDRTEVIREQMEQSKRAMLASQARRIASDLHAYGTALRIGVPGAAVEDNALAVQGHELIGDMVDEFIETARAEAAEDTQQQWQRRKKALDSLKPIEPEAEQFSMF